MMDLTCLCNASVVLDNNVLQDLFEIDCLDLLFEIFNETIIPKIVYDEEIMDCIKSKISKLRFTLKDINTEKSQDIYSILTNEQKYRRLSFNDKQVIAIAGDFNFYAGSNDGLIRRVCNDLGIRITGTLGILGCALQKGIISKTKFSESIVKMSSGETSCYIKKELIDEFLLKVDIEIILKEGVE